MWMSSSKKHLAYQAVFCLSFWRSLSAINRMHLLFWKPSLLVSRCSASAGLLHSPLMAVGTSHTAVCVCVCVEGGVFLCSCLFSLSSRKKWNWYSHCLHFSAKCLTMLRRLALFASALHAHNEIRQVISVTNVRINSILTCTLLNGVTNGVTD